MRYSYKDVSRKPLFWLKKVEIMKFSTFFLMCIMMAGCSSATLVVNDAQALSYCKRTKSSYVVIVWPKGFSRIHYIIKTLNRYASVKYVKKFVCDDGQMFALYRALHKQMSYKSAKKYFKPYLKAYPHRPLGLAALILDTEAPLETIIRWKKEIRDHIGEGFYSIHINDHYDPETVEAAQAVFGGTHPVI